MNIIWGDIVVKYVGTKEYPYDWEIQQKIVVELSNGVILKVPIGYVTDFASVPRWLWSLISPQGVSTNLASIIHDYLYTEHPYDRKFADKEFLLWLNYLSCKHKLRNRLMYVALRIFGKPRWEKYAVEKSL